MNNNKKEPLIHKSPIELNIIRNNNLNEKVLKSKHVTYFQGRQNPKITESNQTDYYNTSGVISKLLFSWVNMILKVNLYCIF